MLNQNQHYVAMILNGHILEHQVNVPWFTELLLCCWTMRGLISFCYKYHCGELDYGLVSPSCGCFQHPVEWPSFPPQLHTWGLYTLMLRKRGVNIYLSPMVYLVLGHIHLQVSHLILSILWEIPIIQVRKMGSSRKKTQRNNLLSISQDSWLLRESFFLTQYF